MKYNSSGTSVIVEIPLMHSAKTLPNYVGFHFLIRRHYCQYSCVCKLTVNSTFCVLNASMLLLLALNNYFTSTFRSVKQIFLLNFYILFRDVLDGIKLSELRYKRFFVIVIISKKFFFS
jgi:hypothetical protein